MWCVHLMQWDSTCLVQLTVLLYTLNISVLQRVPSPFWQTDSLLALRRRFDSRWQHDLQAQSCTGWEPSRRMRKFIQQIDWTSSCFAAKLSQFFLKGVCPLSGWSGKFTISVRETQDPRWKMRRILAECETLDLRQLVDNSIGSVTRATITPFFASKRPSLLFSGADFSQLCLCLCAFPGRSRPIQKAIVVLSPWWCCLLCWLFLSELVAGLWRFLRINFQGKFWKRTILQGAGWMSSRHLVCVTHQNMSWESLRFWFLDCRSSLSYHLNMELLPLMLLKTLSWWFFHERRQGFIDALSALGALQLPETTRNLCAGSTVHIAFRSFALFVCTLQLRHQKFNVLLLK